MPDIFKIYFPFKRIVFYLLVFSQIISTPGFAQQELDSKSLAPIDLTGIWVSVITEDWRWRMLTPPRNDYSSIPLTAAAIEITEQWDPAEDVRNDNTCRPFGAAGLMRLPTRLSISWVNGQTMRIESDSGKQVRNLHFSSQNHAGEPTWQGISEANWELLSSNNPQRGGSLKVITRKMKSGYLRWNGVPYSENAVLTEYFDRHSAFGQEWFTVTSIVEDPLYLRTPFITSSHFRKEEDESRWSSSNCVTAQPPVEFLPNLSDFN